MADPANPIVVQEAATGAMVAAGIRGITVLLAGLLAILGFVRQRDLAGLVAYLQSDSFVPVAAAIIAVATLVNGQWSAWRRHRNAVTMADAAPDDVAVVKASSPQSN